MVNGIHLDEIHGLVNSLFSLMIIHAILTATGENSEATWY
jgi:hypothetical protein